VALPPIWSKYWQERAILQKGLHRETENNKRGHCAFPQHCSYPEQTALWETKWEKLSQSSRQLCYFDADSGFKTASHWIKGT